MVATKSFGEIFDIEKGSLQSSKGTPGEYTFITASSEWKTNTTFSHDCEAIVLAVAASGSLGRAHYYNGKFIASDLCLILTPKNKKEVNLKFFYYLLNFFRERIVKANATGTAKISINSNKLKNYEVIFPNIEIQNTFLKNMEFMNEKYSELNLHFEEDKDCITKLRQAILREAVSGKLVPQDPNDEPASKLLEKIKAEKERLVHAKKIKRDKPLPPITEEEVPYELPKGWTWTRLGEIAEIKGGKRLPNGYTLTKEDTGHIYIRVTDMKNGSIDDSDLHYISNEAFEQIRNYFIEKDDIYLVIVGSTIGKSGIVPEKFHRMNLTENAVKIKPYLFERLYLDLVLKTVLLQNQFYNKTNQLGQPKLAIIRTKSSLFPLPPLSEQNRIVEKTNHLMKHCSELEEKINENQNNSELLMEAVLTEAFAS